MTAGSANLAVVPARGGSKGVPGKNLRVIAGRSLLERAVRCGQEAARITDVVVSTDDDRIAEEAEQAGAIVVHRPPELATDAAPTPPVVVHAMAVMETEHGRSYDNVVLLQPPAPLRTGHDVDHIIELLETTPELDSAVSVYQVGDNHPGRMYRLDGGGALEALHPEQEQMRRQDLPPVYHRNGAIYAARARALRETGSLLTGRVGAYVMDPGWTVNIDGPEDLIVAEHVVGRWDESMRLV